MIIEGKKIAEKILQKLKLEVEKLKLKGSCPTFIIILVGQNPISLNFIEQKKKKAESVGIKVLLRKLPSSSSKKRVQETIRKYNLDLKIHGVIVQLPLPSKLHGATEEIIQTVAPLKDIDGFVKNSPYTPAVALAVLKVLEIAQNEVQPHPRSNLAKWLHDKKIVIIGRGPTAGRPIAQTFAHLDYPFKVAHSQTKNLKALTKKADIIISCVGKEKLISGEMVKKEAIIIDVGMTRNRQGKLVGDLDPETVSKVAAFYTPTPGGTGPLTVACLLENVIRACYNQKRKKYELFS